jgi:YVTN family beta-propeller protein
VNRLRKRTIAETASVAGPPSPPTPIAMPTLPSRAYMANFDSNKVTVIDTTNIVLGTPIAVGNSPAGVGIGP